MIDFKDGSYLKLKEIPPAEAFDLVGMMLVDGEELFAAFKSVRDHVNFTNKRIIAVNVQGMSGRKKDYTSLPYSKIQAFSVETGGTFDLDAELELWFSGLGKGHFEFRSRFDIRAFNKIIGSYVL